MKILIVFSLSMFAIVCISCKREKAGELEHRIPVDWFFSLHVKEPKTGFKDGLFTVDFEIESDFEGEVFILMVLRHPYTHEDDPNFDVCVPIRGFGNDVKVDGYQICS